MTKLLFSALLLLSITSFAAEPYEQVDATQEKIGKIKHDILTSQGRLNPDEIAYQLLETAYELLSVMDAQLSGYGNVLVMQYLITTPANMKKGQAVADLMKKHIRATADAQAEHLEKQLKWAKEHETTRILLAARDAEKEVSALFQ